MTNAGWSLLQFAAHLLAPEEREAVLGDFLESGESACRAVIGVIGLAFRRQALLWKSWRPWLAGFGLTLPGSFLLMGVSVSVSWSYQRLLCPQLLAAASLTMRSGLLLLFCQAIVLCGCAWAGGFVVGSLSRRTLCTTAALCCVPCLFCLSRFRVESLSPFCLFLFLLPAVWGVRQGLRISRMNFDSATVLALTITVLMLPAWSANGHHWWNLTWVLILPAWYLVATAQRPNRLPAAS
ncbi:MAG TPA: hypothetical protein VMH20_14235 [Verrucomicrobiae bacterium]|nr:hypothetical protein [Verrucomicrobiae bacterium]